MREDVKHNAEQTASREMGTPDVSGYRWAWVSYYGGLVHTRPAEAINYSRTDIKMQRQREWKQFPTFTACMMGRALVKPHGTPRC